MSSSVTRDGSRSAGLRHVGVEHDASAVGAQVVGQRIRDRLRTSDREPPACRVGVGPEQQSGAGGGE